MHIGLVDLKWAGHHTPYVVYLTQYFVEEGHQVTFITDRENERLDELPADDNFRVHTSSYPTVSGKTDTSFAVSLREQWNRTKQLRQVFDAASDERVDVVHLLHFDGSQIPLWLASRLTDINVPVVATIHRDAFLSPSGRNPGKRLTKLATTLALDVTLETGTLDVLTVHADPTRDRIIGGIDSATYNNTRTIPAPTPENSIDRSIEELRDDLSLPPERDLLLFFGGLREEKGPDILARLIREVDRPLTVVYAGSPSNFTATDVDRWAEHVSPPVEILARLEFIPEDEVDAYFTAADALVLPYRRKRGISGPLRRAAMAETPVLSRARSDIGQIVEQHGLGETFELDDVVGFRQALDSVLTDDESHSTRLRTFASSRHWSETGDALLTIYEKMTSRKPN